MPSGKSVKEKERWIARLSLSLSLRSGGGPPPPPPTGAIQTEDLIDITTENDVPLLPESAP